MKDLLTTRDLLAAGWSAYAIRQKVKRGEWVKVRRGLYYPKVATVTDHQLLSTMLPHAVWALHSAASIHELSTYVPHQYHLAIPGKSRPQLPPNPPVQLLFWGGSRYQLGQTTIVVDDHPTTVYDREKTVCDFIRLRRKLGEAAVNEVLRNYVQQPARDLTRLSKYATQLGDQRMLSQYLKILL